MTKTKPKQTTIAVRATPNFLTAIKTIATMRDTTMGELAVQALSKEHRKEIEQLIRLMEAQDKQRQS